MKDRLSAQEISAVIRKAFRTDSLIRNEDTSVIFYDLSFLSRRMHELKVLFPESSLHAIAIKANPLVKILRRIASAGLGFEVATAPELHLALDSGVPPNKVVFDSPTKTKEELAYALSLGVHINADSLEEVERIGALLQDQPLVGTIGVRINPQVGTGKILSTSVAGDYSKFGVPLKEQRRDLINAFIKHNWLTGVHLHIGSQGCDPQLLLKGAEKVVEFVHEVNGLTHPSARISIVDLGGGLPVSYRENEQPTSMSQYKEALNNSFPELFNGEFTLFTEFGRYIHANSGWVMSRVEYVKNGRSINTAMIHVGADLFLRECYNPLDWYHEIIVLDSAGKLKAGLVTAPYMVAGPLCFASDIVGREVQLPKIETGDYIVIKDTGAYTLSMWSRYNSRQIPKVVGYQGDGIDFEILKEREEIADILRFWA